MCTILITVSVGFTAELGGGVFKTYIS